jgi:archaemetzincin
VSARTIAAIVVVAVLIGGAVAIHFVARDETFQRSLENHGEFAPMPRPGPVDWLSWNKEPGQTLGDFLRRRHHVPDRKRNVIYLQPVGTIDAQFVEKLRAFAGAFFALEARTLPPIAIDLATVTHREPRGFGTQLRTDGLLRLLVPRRPADAFCVLAVTDFDLYPGDQWNYVFGVGAHELRAGVYSFARFHEPLREPTTDGAQIFLRRSCALVAHETGHIFSLAHCIDFACVMNGSNHIHELDAHPLHLCPRDLEKLHASVPYDPLRYNAQLRDVTARIGLRDESAWYAKRVARISGALPSNTP